jgi:AraC-like DNA-binding protein
MFSFNWEPDVVLILPMDSLTNSVDLQEINLTGDQIDLPLVRRLGLLRSQKASRITWHSHDCHEILILADGATEYEFRDGTVQSLTGGHFLVIPPGVEHRGLYNFRRPARLCGVLFDLARPDSVIGTPFLASDLTWIADQVNTGACAAHRMSYDMKGYFKLLLSDLKKLHMADRSMIISMRSLVCAILHHAARRIISERTMKPSRVVENAIAYMKSNLDAEASIEGLTKAVSCSRARLFKLFKETVGMTPNDYWQRLRIDLSIELLKDPNKSITDVAFESGFASSQYFSTVFRKYSGRSPTEYRNAESAPVCENG